MNIDIKSQNELVGDETVYMYRVYIEDVEIFHTPDADKVGLLLKAFQYLSENETEFRVFDLPA